MNNFIGNIFEKTRVCVCGNIYYTHTHHERAEANDIGHLTSRNAKSA